MCWFVCGLGYCWLGEGCCHSVGLGDLCMSTKHTKTPGVPSTFSECEDHQGLMLARALAGPTVEQQGEMARSGGRMLATLEPEQVRTLTDSLERSGLTVKSFGPIYS